MSSGGLGWGEVVAAVFRASLCFFRSRENFVPSAMEKVEFAQLRIVGF